MHQRFVGTSHLFRFSCVIATSICSFPLQNAEAGFCDDDFCCKGDMDQSNDLNGQDIQQFVEAMLSPAECGSPEFCAADADDNGFLELEDVSVFVALMIAGDPCPNPPSNYCPAGALDEFDEEFISRVVLASLNNQSGGNSLGNYQDFTALAGPNLQVSVSTPITVTISNYFAADIVKVWVDWNHDSDFLGSGEQLFLSDSGVGTTGTATGAITPPPAAAIGATRMRIRLFFSFGDELDFGPCGQAEFGEVEDYTIHVMP